MQKTTNDLINLINFSKDKLDSNAQLLLKVAELLNEGDLTRSQFSVLEKGLVKIEALEDKLRETGI